MQLENQWSAPRNPSLYNALREYVEVAIQLAKDLAKNAGPNTECFDNTTFPHIEFRRGLAALSEFDACVSELMSDENINEHLDVVVGCSSLRKRSPTAKGLALILPYLGIRENKLVFNKEFFDCQYHQFERGFYETELEYEVVAPLYGIGFENVVQIDDDVTFHIVDGFSLDPVETTTIGPDRIAFNEHWAIVTRYRIPKRFDDSTFDAVAGKENDDKIRKKANDRIESALTALRLLQGHSVSATKRIHRTKNWFFPDYRVFSASFEPETQFTLQTGKEFETALVHLWRALKDDRFGARRSLAVAAKRFSYSHERVDWEDQMIDLLIAAESLFLPSGNKTELNYRLRLNAALYLGSDPDTRRRVFEDFGLAYELRSSIVHGGDPTKIYGKIERREDGRFGDRYRFVEFTERIREYIRFTLVRMIKMSEGLDDQFWDALALRIGEKSDAGES